MSITTIVPIVGEDELPRQIRKLGERDEDLANYARHGYELAHTATITGREFVTFVDTLTRADDRP